MEAQKPAEGVMQLNEWGTAKMYRIACDCGDTGCDHTLDVEADDFGVNVNIYVTAHSKWWEKSRWKMLWQLLTKGTVELQTTVILKEQVALTYAETLKVAVADVKVARAEANEKFKARQEAKAKSNE